MQAMELKGKDVLVPVGDSAWLAVQLPEGLLRAAPAAVHRQLDHPGDLLGAVQHGCAGD